MEQHPVPQNITSFQFRLIGDMTIKQFGYLAGGIVLAFIFYKLPLPFFFTWPLAITAALTGFGFAFVPIEERPMDIWVFSFLRNVYSPTVFHWEHTDPLPEPSKSQVPPIAKIPNLSIPHFPLPTPNKTQQAPSAPPSKPIPTPLVAPKQQTSAPFAATSRLLPEQHKTSLFDSFFSFIDNLFVIKPHAPPAYVVQPQMRPRSNGSGASQTPNIQPQQFQPMPQAMPSVVGTKIEPIATEKPILSKEQPKSVEEKKTEEDLSTLKAQLESVQKQLTEKTTEEKRVVELQQQLTSFMTERQQMEKELLALREKTKNTTPQAPQPMRQAGVVQAQKPSEPTVQTMNPDIATRAGLPRLTTFPNVVTGIIKDYDNNLLPGVLVTVKDKDGVPLRALKTNKLGQFAASTQLLNGTYVVEVEDPRERFVFDRAQITINGTVLPALQIIAKSKRSLDREKLEKELFGSPNANS